MADFANGTTPIIPLKLYLSGSNTDATGKTVAVTISKNGAAFGNPSAGATNATEIGNGWYYYTPSATDSGTNGALIVRGTASGCDNSEVLHFIVPATNGRLSALPATACTTNASLLTSGSSTDQIAVSSGNVTAALTGDLSATMKISVTTACTASTPTAAAVTGAVGSVTATVNANVTKVNSITITGSGVAVTDEWRPA